MNVNGSVLENLPAGECLRLLATAPVGRIIYTRQALPAVEPVNFAMHGGNIVIRTGAGGKLAAAIRQTVVAFEADDLDPAARSGWSVTVVGHCQEVTGAGEIGELHKLGLRPWAPGAEGYFIRIRPGIVTGRRLRPAQH